MNPWLQVVHYSFDQLYEMQRDFVSFFFLHWPHLLQWPQDENCKSNKKELDLIWNTVHDCEYSSHSLQLLRYFFLHLPRSWNSLTTGTINNLRKTVESTLTWTNDFGHWSLRLTLPGSAVAAGCQQSRESIHRFYIGDMINKLQGAMQCRCAQAGDRDDSLFVGWLLNVPATG